MHTILSPSTRISIAEIRVTLKRQTDNREDSRFCLWQWIWDILRLSLRFAIWLFATAKWIHSQLSEVNKDLYYFILDHYLDTAFVLIPLMCVLPGFDLLKKHGVIMRIPVSVLSFYCHYFLAITPDETILDAETQVQNFIVQYFIGCIKTVLVVVLQNFHPRLCACFFPKQACTEEKANDIQDHLKKVANKAKAKRMKKVQLRKKLARIHLAWLAIEWCINIGTAIETLNL